MYEAIPDVLREIPRWVAFRFVDRESDGKPTKVLVSPHTGRYGKANDPGTWGTFEQAQERANQDELPGVGFVFADDDDILGIDLDKCRDLKSGELEDWARDIVAALDSYTELSPSGTGVHVIARGKLPKKGRKKGGIEMYESRRFFTMTGQHLVGTPETVEERHEQVAALHAEVFGAPKGQQVHVDMSKAPEPLSDDELLTKARRAADSAKFEALWSGDITDYPSHSEADLALCGKLAFWTRRDATQIDRLFRVSGLYRPKWDEQRGEQTYGEKTIGEAITGCATEWRGAGSSKPHAAVAEGRVSVRPLTDTGNAERLHDLASRDLRYVHRWKKWLAWDTKRWHIDDRGRALLATKVAARSFYKQASQLGDGQLAKACERWARKSEKRSARNAMLELLTCEDGIPIGVADLDQDPWLLNCTNGTLNLKSGVLQRHRREDYITKLSPVAYDPAAECPLWDAFLEQILPDDELRGFVQRAAGWSLTGDVSQQVLMFCYGLGANGKSTFLLTLLAMLGEDYSMQATTNLLLEKQQEAHPTALADLLGKRLAVCVEMGAKRKFDEVLVKQLTGGDKVRARRMHEDHWEFAPTHHLWLGANHKPAIHGAEEAIWRRILLIPFTVSIPEEDRDLALPAKLQRELPGILAWAVRGCRQWQEKGLAAPQAVRGATEAYRSDMDVVGRFIEAQCDADLNSVVSAKDLLGAYTAWARDAGEVELTQQTFGQRLSERGLERKKRKGRMYYAGLALKPADEDVGGGGGPLPGTSQQLHDEPHTAHTEKTGKSSPSSPPPDSGRRTAPEKGGESVDLWGSPQAAGPGRARAGDADESDFGAMGRLEREP